MRGEESLTRWLSRACTLADMSSSMNMALAKKKCHHGAKYVRGVEDMYLTGSLMVVLRA